ncbi:MAG: putative collagen-binding domain-containing protein [Eubacteriales bacterium]|nr:putative collagen-binding domain-containing protein [Eubacteriales bacterium]
MLAYTYTGRTICLDLGAYEGKTLDAYWMDPATGAMSFIREVTGEREVSFTPPPREDGPDSLLVVRCRERE